MKTKDRQRYENTLNELMHMSEFSGVRHDIEYLIEHSSVRAIAIAFDTTAELVADHMLQIHGCGKINWSQDRYGRPIKSK